MNIRDRARELVAEALRHRPMNRTVVVGVVIDALAPVWEELDAFTYLRLHMLPPGECYTLPNGNCIGVGCIHDA